MTGLTIAPRDPRKVMTLARMGSFHQCRLSFMRILLRRLKREGWRFDRPRFDIDARGVGVAVYSAHGPRNSYSLVAFANDLPPEKRSDRVIATEWDATFTLFDGVPGEDDIARLARNIPLQEAGRVRQSELSVSRANRSVRLWDHVVERLSTGRQPDPEMIEDVGYLMRTTAVYGSGKLGAADREWTENRPEFRAPFQIEMLSVYLTRAFVLDLVDHMAKVRAPGKAVSLAPEMRRRLGIGNSTGLGMAPFLINHPVLLHSWIAAREKALARVRALPRIGADAVQALRALAARAHAEVDSWRSAHPLQAEKLARLRADMRALCDHLETADLAGALPLDALYLWGEAQLGIDGQELLVSLMLEPFPDLVDPLAEAMHADEANTTRIDGTMSTARLRAIVEDVYDWALAIDWDDPGAQANVWYTSEEKLEPRLGGREEPGIAAYEQPLCPGRDAARMHRDLAGAPDTSVGAFLMRFPQHRHIARRAQIAARFPYAEIRDNTIGADLLPIDLLRAKLAFFGAGHFDPRSDRWVRINMYRNAPLPAELSQVAADDWSLPALERTMS